MLRLGLAAPRASLISAAFYELRFLLPSTDHLGFTQVFSRTPSPFLSVFLYSNPLVSSLVSRGNSPWNHQIFGRALRREGKRFGAKISKRERERDSSLFQNVGKNANKKAKYSDIYFPRFCQILPQIFASDSDQLLDSKGNSRVSLSLSLSSITGKNSRVARSWTTP